VIDVREIKDPYKVATNYIWGTFIFDVVAVQPYTVINPWMIFLRNLKFIKELGAEVGDIHNVISFQQKPWLK
jgi:hypothetical protein